MTFDLSTFTPVTKRRSQHSAYITINPARISISPYAHKLLEGSNVIQVLIDKENLAIFFRPATPDMEGAYRISVNKQFTCAPILKLLRPDRRLLLPLHQESGGLVGYLTEVEKIT